MADGYGWVNDLYQSPYFQGGSAALSAGADINALIQQLRQWNLIRNVSQILQNPNAIAAGTEKFMPTLSPQFWNLFRQGLGGDWRAMTGGGVGGASSQYAADAVAKLLIPMYQQAQANYVSSLTGSSGAASRLSPAAGGNLGGLMRQLQTLAGIGQAPQSPSLVTTPVPGGSGFGGGSEAFRDYTPSGGLVLGGYD